MRKSSFRLVLILVFTACISGLYLPKDFWFDELWTLKAWIARGLRGVFTEYRQPNNHIIFSGTLLIWKHLCCWLGLPEKCLRLLPWLCTLGGVALIYQSVKLWRGPAAALWAALLLGSSHCFLYYSCQLRGYPLSYLEYGLGLYLMLKLLQKPSAWKLAAYNLVVILSVGTLPTNLIPFFCLGLWGALALYRTGELKTGEGKLIAVSLLLSPIGGMLWYFWHPTVREQFFWHAMSAHSNRAAVELLLATLNRTFRDWLWLIPFFASGIYLSCIRGRTKVEIEQPWSFGWFAAAVFLPLLGGYFLAYYPRNFSPLITWWCVVLGVLINESCKAIISRWPKLRPLPVVLLIILCSLSAVKEISLAVEKPLYLYPWNDPRPFSSRGNP